MTSPFARTPDPDDPSPWLKSSQFPVRAACNPWCPDESWLWTMAGIPGTNGAPFIMNIPYLRVVSRHLFNLFGPPPKDAALKYRPPTGREPNWMTAPGTWVPIDAPDPQQQRLMDRVPFDVQVQLKKEALASMSRDEIAETLGVELPEEDS